MTVEQQIKELNYKRLKAWEHGKALLDHASAEGRGMTAEEQRGYDRANAEITMYDRQREELLSSDASMAELEQVTEELRRVTTPGAVEGTRDRENAQLRALLKPGSANRTMTVDISRAQRVFDAYRAGARGQEFRVLAGDTGSSGGSLTVPSLVASEIYTKLVISAPVLQTRAHVEDTQGGGPWTVPVGSQGLASQVLNQNTQFAGTDPSFAGTVFHAYDVGELVAIGADLVEDTSVDLLSWVGRAIGRAVGTKVGAWLATGTGSGQPTGVMNGGGVGAAGTIASGGSLLLGAVGQVMDRLIDVAYSVASPYRNAPAEWLMNDQTTATIRKIRDGAGGTSGQYVWQPSPTVGMSGGQPDVLLGYVCHSDSNVASMASDSRPLAFGDFNAFYVRRAAPSFRLERSDDLYFDKNQVALRGLTRVDSNLVDTTALNYLHMAVT